MKSKLFLILIIVTVQLNAQSILPPILEWHGNSESLIAKAKSTWITSTEESDFVTVPTYDKTNSWFRKLT